MKRMKSALCATVLAVGVLFSAMPNTAITAKAAEDVDFEEIMLADKGASTGETISANKANFGPFINDMLFAVQEQVKGMRIVDLNYDTVRAYGKSKVPNAQDNGQTYTSADGRYEYETSSNSRGYRSVYLTIDGDIEMEGFYYEDEQISGAFVASNQNTLPISAKYQSLSNMSAINNVNPVNYFNSLFANGGNVKNISFSDGTKLCVQKIYSGAYLITYVTASEKSGVGLGYEDGALLEAMVLTTPNESFPSAIPADGAPGAMYRLYNPFTGEHFYTGDVNERNVLVSQYRWENEGIGWMSPITRTGAPVYRLYNSATGEHFYTRDANERNVLISQYRWDDEGIGFYSDDNHIVPVYRLFNPKATSAVSSHHYTTDANERNVLISQYGWEDEGISWYGN